MMVVSKSRVRLILLFDIPRTLCRNRSDKKKVEKYGDASAPESCQEDPIAYQEELQGARGACLTEFWASERL
jgi:hypothetical protein